MKFCDKCDNLFYLSIDSDNPNKVIYYCRCCGNINTDMINDGGCIIDTKTTNSNETHDHINEFTKNDPTIPHLYDVLCINKNYPTYNKNTTTETSRASGPGRGVGCITWWGTNRPQGGRLLRYQQHPCGASHASAWGMCAWPPVY